MDRCNYTEMWNNKCLWQSQCGQLHLIVIDSRIISNNKSETLYNRTVLQKTEQHAAYSVLATLFYLQ
jgi:hypothetical protein